MLDIQYTKQELPRVAKQIISNLKHRIVIFQADMGVGKTTLIQALCKELGVEDVVSSPTFSIVNEYKISKANLNSSASEDAIFHFDFYRINAIAEAYDIGFEEYLDTRAWIFIEWPSKVSSFLEQEEFDTISIKVIDGQHNITLSS